MATWDWEEMEALASQFKISQDELSNLYERYDGIPRYCFDYQDVRPDLDSVMATTPALNLLTRLTESKNVSIDITHQLIKIVPTPNFRKFTHTFLSKYVMDNLPDILVKREKEAVVGLVTESLISVPTAQSLRGPLFEALDQLKLANGDPLISNNGRNEFVIPHVDVKQQPKQDSFEKYLKKDQRDATQHVY
jgi:hypothetical protein